MGFNVFNSFYTERLTRRSKRDIRLAGIDTRILAIVIRRYYRGILYIVYDILRYRL